MRLLLFFALAACVPCFPGEQPVAVEVEAESASPVKSPLAVREASGASGGKVLYASPDLWRRSDRFVASELKQRRVGGVGLAEYEIEVPREAAYCTWFRCWYLNSGDDSFYFRADDGAWHVISELKQFEWRWIRGPLLRLSAGRHRFQIVGREDNSILDKFVLFADAGYVPPDEAKRLGPVERFTMPLPTEPGQPGGSVAFLNHFDNHDSADATHAQGDARVGGMHWELGVEGRFGKGALISHPKAYMLILGQANAPSDALTIDLWFKPKGTNGIFGDEKEHYLLSILFEPWLHIQQGPLQEHRRHGKDQLFAVLDGKAKRLRLLAHSAARLERIELFALSTEGIGPTGWRHFALSWEKAAGRFWMALDGRGQTRVVRHGWDFRPILGLYVGSATYYSVLKPLDGAIDELRIRSAALSELLASDR